MDRTDFSVADDDRWMDEALAEARAAVAHDDVPIGAVVVRAGKVIGRGRNRREVDHDPTAHAEILALREAARALGRWRLDDCAMYVTLEPCAMCAGAAVLARLALVVFGAPEPRTGAVISVTQLLDEPQLNHHPKWRLGVKREECERLVADFFKSRRSDRFVWEQGDIDITRPGTLVAGEPALFLGSGDREWRRAIAEVTTTPGQALALEFTVASYKRRGHSFDIDNLCKPVLDELKWSPTTIWARVQVGASPGLRIFDAEPPPPPRSARRIDIAAPPGRSHRTTGLPELLSEGLMGRVDEPVGLELAFHGADVRIHDFGFEGPVKPLIDGMFVILGGASHRPADHRIKDLRLRRGVMPQSSGVTVAIWPLDGEVGP